MTKTMDDLQFLVMFGLLSIGPQKRGTSKYRDMLTLAEKIIRRLEQYIKPIETKPAVALTGDDFLEKLEKLASLTQAWLLTDEEFTIAKAKSLQ